MAEYWQHRTVRDFLRVIFSRWVMALLIVAIVIGSAVAATFLLPQVYEAEARLQAPMSPAEQTLSGDIRTDSTWEVRLKMQHDVLTGDTVLSRALAIYNNPALRRVAVVEKNGWLAPGAEKKADYPDKVLMAMLSRLEYEPPRPADAEETLKAQKAVEAVKAHETPEERDAREKKDQETAKAKTKDAAEARQARDAAKALDAAAADIVKNHQEDLIKFRKDVRMEVQGGQQTAKSLSFSIFVRADQAGKAKLLADLVTEEFSFRYHELLLAQLKSRYMPTKADRDRMQADPASDYRKAKRDWELIVNPYKSTAEFLMVVSLLNKGPNTDVGAGRNQTESIGKYIDKDSQAKGLAVLEQKLKAVVDVFDSEINGQGEVKQFPFIPLEMMTQPAIAELCKNLAAKFVQRAELTSKYKDDQGGRYQLLVDVKSDIRQLERDLLMLFRAELEGIAARKAVLEEELKPHREFLGDAPAKGSGKIENLGTRLAQIGEIYNTWTTQLQLYADQDGRASRAERDYNTATQSSQLTISDNAIQPDKPIRPIVWLNLLVGGLVGVLLALTYVFLADYYDHTVRSIDDVERYLGVPVLASVGRIGRHAVQAS